MVCVVVTTTSCIQRANGNGIAVNGNRIAEMIKFLGIAGLQEGHLPPSIGTILVALKNHRITFLHLRFCHLRCVFRCAGHEGAHHQRIAIDRSGVTKLIPLLAARRESNMRLAVQKGSTVMG